MSVSGGGLNVVLVEPEIPQNTGSVGRLCLAVGATLHLVEPLGFDIDHKKLKRAGLDYWEHLDVRVHSSLESFEQTLAPEDSVALIENRSGRVLYDFSFTPGTYLIFGRETTGLPEWLLEKYSDRTLTIPMFDARIRSLNLANSVSIAVYEAVRQIGFSGAGLGGDLEL